MNSGFSSSETNVLERQICNNGEQCVKRLHEIWNLYQSKKCISWILANNFQKICLQFPEDYLVYSNTICSNLKNIISNHQNEKNERSVFILGDTTYSSCCVDETAASHVEADCIIHFGNACRSESIRLPVLYCFPHFDIDIEHFCQQLILAKERLQNGSITIYLDIGYHHVLNIIENNSTYLDNLRKLSTKSLFIVKYGDNSYGILSSNNQFCTYSSDHSTGLNNIESCGVLVYVGSDNERFFQLSLKHKAVKWFTYDVVNKNLKEENPLIAKYIRHRYFYIEKCKDAKTLGLLVATLTSNGYLEIIKRLQTMAKQNGVRTQIISVGRINPAKLANFLEIDCFVLIGCPFNVPRNSKDYFKPIITVFEAEMALNPVWHEQYPEIYVTDFKELLQGGKYFKTYEHKQNRNADVSLINGQLRNWSTINDFCQEESTVGQKNVCAQNDKIVCSNNDLLLTSRLWRGLDPNLGNDEPAKLQKGLSGIPTRYKHISD